jgi:hypothetical protein
MEKKGSEVYRKNFSSNNTNIPGIDKLQKTMNLLNLYNQNESGVKKHGNDLLPPPASTVDSRINFGMSFEGSPKRRPDTAH